MREGKLPSFLHEFPESKSELLVEAVGVPRAQDLQRFRDIRMVLDASHEELPQASSPMVGVNHDVGNPGEDRVVGDNPGETNLPSAAKN